MMKQNAFLQRRQRIDILHIRYAARNRRDDAVDLLRREMDQWQHVGRDRRASRGNEVWRSFEHARSSDRSGQSGRRRRCEQRAHIGLQSVLPQSLDQCHRQQRVPAELEEIIVDADTVAAEEVRPDPAQRLLGRCARRDIAARDLRIHARRGQGLAIDLAIGGQWQRLEQDVGGWQHVIGQVARESRSQCGDVERVVAARDQIGDEPLVAGRILARDHDDLTNVGDPRQRGLDLAELDAKASDFHLMIGAAQKFEVRIRPVASQIAGAIEAFSGLAERIRREALRGQIGTAEIAAREPCAADVELSRDADRNRLERAIEEIDLRVGDRTPDRRTLFQRAVARSSSRRSSSLSVHSH